MNKTRLNLILPALLLVGMAMVPIASAYQSSNYGTNYGDGLDTTPQSQTAQSEQSSMGYSAGNYQGSTATSAFNRIASDNVFFFDGHGDAGLMEFRNGGVSSFITANNPGNIRLSSYTSGQMNDIALAVYMACNTANTGSVNGNLLDESTSRGVDTAMGFSNLINSAQSGYWSNRYWYYLDERYNFNDAAVYSLVDTRSYFGWLNVGGMDSYAIRGSLSSTIDPARAGY
jgi:hypothetical protein